MSRRVSLALLVFLAALSLGLVFLLRVKDEMVDFEVNYTAAARLRLGETLYRSEDGHYQFKYLPFSAFLYLPLSFLPLDVAKGMWFGIVLVCSVFIFLLSFRLLPGDKKKTTWMAIIAPLVLARYFLREIQLGQINALITLLLLLTIWMLCRQSEGSSREIGAGLLAGLATALKPYAMVFMPYFVLRKKWSSLISSLLALLLGLAAPSLFYGLPGNWLVLREWVSSLASSTPALFSTQDNVSLMGCLVKWTSRPGLSFVFYGVILVGLSTLCLYLVARGKTVSEPVVLEGFLLLTLIPLLSPLGWDYTFLSATPAIILILYFFDRFSRIWRYFLALDLAIIGMTLYDVMGRTAYALFMSSSVITICFLVIVGYISFLRIKSLA